jgi:autotransporter translocation and assembly factor TamB
VGVVAIGKHLTPDLYVNFEKGVTGEEGNQVNVEYRLNRHLSIQTEFGGTQQSGIDVFWRYDFGK